MSEDGDEYKYVDLFSSADHIKISLSMLNKVVITQEEKTQYNLKMMDLHIVKNFYYHEGMIEDIIPLHDQSNNKGKGDMKSLRNYYGDSVA